MFHAFHVWFQWFNCRTPGLKFQRFLGQKHLEKHEVPLHHQLLPGSPWAPLSFFEKQLYSGLIWMNCRTSLTWKQLKLATIWIWEWLLLLTIIPVTENSDIIFNSERGVVSAKRTKFWGYVALILWMVSCFFALKTACVSRTNHLIY